MTELAKRTLSKEEFVYWSNWISMRWPSVKNDPKQLKSLYEDFSHFNDDIIGQAAVEQLDQGSEFFSWPRLKKRCKEIYFEELKQRIDQAKTEKHKQDLMQDKPSSFRQYLNQNGWNSADEAIFYTRVRLYRENKLLSWDMPNMKKFVDMDYKSAKDAGWKQGEMEMK